jgi:glycosyltransferase involved in cell wall biosynthesis
MELNSHLSLLLLTKNEQENIKRYWTWLDKCLAINEIIVVDDNSTDDTVNELKKLATSHRQVKIYAHDLAGDFSQQRTFGVSKATNDWVLWLDADEILTNKLIEYINNIDITQYNAFSFKRNDIFLGKELKHGETANQYFIRLFNKHFGSFEGKVHEIWQPTSSVSKTDLVIYHYSHPTLYSFIQKINFYSDLRSQELYSQKAKVSLSYIITYPLAKFISDYVLKLGFLDSTQGIIMALSMSLHSFLVRAKLWHLYQK